MLWKINTILCRYRSMNPWYVETLRNTLWKHSQISPQAATKAEQVPCPNMYCYIERKFLEISQMCHLVNLRFCKYFANEVVSGRAFGLSLKWSIHFHDRSTFPYFFKTTLPEYWFHEDRKTKLTLRNSNFKTNCDLL